MASELGDGSARTMFDEAARRALGESVPVLGGRGIVICGGGVKYLTCAWVCVNLLRRLRCELPIQFWHLGPREMPDGVRTLLEPLGVTFVDALAVRERRPVRTLNGWELKPYAILHSDFREVLLLDADNAPVSDPTYLFDAPQYLQHGAVFWPDFGRLGRDRSVWRLSGVEYRDEPEFETGQVLVDKSRCWAELNLTMWMNEHSDYWYRHVHGDKETFHIAWRKLGRTYAMPARGIHALHGTMCQHDFEGKRVFQHRNLAKWSLSGNARVRDFQWEDLCLEFVEQLRRAGGHRLLAGFPTPSGPLATELGGKRAVYTRVGYETRPIFLGPDGSIEGGGGREQFWAIEGDGEDSRWAVYGDDAIRTMTLTRDDGPTWKGVWESYERMPVRVSVCKSDADEPTFSSRTAEPSRPEE